MSGEQNLLCRQCRNIFKSKLLPDSSPECSHPCPKCGSLDVTEAPIWAPLGSGLNIYEGSEWEYECQQCREKFKMPIPESPAENKARTCPFCGSGHLHSLTAVGGEPLYCG